MLGILDWVRRVLSNLKRWDLGIMHRFSRKLPDEALRVAVGRTGGGADTTGWGNAEPAAATAGARRF